MIEGQSAPLIAGPALKHAAQRYAFAVQAKVKNQQNGLFGIFDKWFAHLFARLMCFDPALPWEEAILAEMETSSKEADQLAEDFTRLRLFLDRREQGRLVDFALRQASAAHYFPRLGTEFDDGVFLMAQGAPALMHWRGVPLLKTVFDYALYPLLLADLRPRTVFEIGSGFGASTLWLADHLALLGIEAHVHSVDIKPPVQAHPGVTFHRGDCAAPKDLFTPDLLASAPRPWLVIEDAHHNVEAVLNHFHQFLTPGDYLFVEDSEVKRRELHGFTTAHPGAYKVDTRYTDYFGRNATCAADSIFVRIETFA